MTTHVDLRLHILAFLYDNMGELPVWMRQLRPGQLQDLAKVMLRWHGTVNRGAQIVPLTEVERREITRAISLCNGDVSKAAKALNLGKTTIYRKLKEWGYSTENRVLMQQASALAQVAHGEKRMHL